MTTEQPSVKKVEIVCSRMKLAMEKQIINNGRLGQLHTFKLKKTKTPKLLWSWRWAIWDYKKHWNIEKGQKQHIAKDRTPRFSSLGMCNKGRIADSKEKSLLWYIGGYQVLSAVRNQFKHTIPAVKYLHNDVKLMTEKRFICSSPSQISEL